MNLTLRSASRRAIKQLRANVPGLSTSGPYSASTLSGSSRTSVASGTEACIRYAISYCAIFDSISGLPVRSRCSSASRLIVAIAAPRRSAVIPAGLETYSTGSALDRNSTPPWCDGRNPELQISELMFCAGPLPSDVITMNDGRSRLSVPRP
jgi:hypothetical protein